MINGFYVAYYTGQAGTGFAIFVLKNGEIVGADAAGGLYDGSYSYLAEKKSYEGMITMRVPANTPLVTGQAPGNNSYAIQFPISLPEESIRNQKPILIQLPVGPVNVNLKKLRDF